MTEKIVLDTDIGSDIDDAVCLAYLLVQPDCDLLGVTTVSGQALERAKLVSVLANVAGYANLSIYPGVEAPLLVPPRQPLAPQAEALPNWDHAIGFSQGEAINFLRQTIRTYPGQVTLVAIGPLTNVGLLFALDAEIPHLLKELVIMGGHYLDGADQREHNILCDPHAAAIVFNSPVRLRAVGLDVTQQVKLDADDVRQRFTTRLLAPVLDFAEVWFRDVCGSITFHDPLAAAAIFDDSLCTFESGQARVEIHDENKLGYTYWSAGDNGGHAVGVTVEPTRFFDHFFSFFG